MDLKQFITDKIKELEAINKKVTEEYFGVNRKTITAWKRTKIYPFEAAAAVFAREVNPPAEPEVPIDENEFVDETIAVPQPKVVKASNIRPSGQPRLVQPRVGGVQRVNGIEVAGGPAEAGPMVTGNIEGATGAPPQVAAVVAAVLAAMGYGGAPGVPTPAINDKLPQGTLQLKPGYGRNWNAPHKKD